MKGIDHMSLVDFTPHVNCNKYTCTLLVRII